MEFNTKCEIWIKNQKLFSIYSFFKEETVKFHQRASIIGNYVNYFEKKCRRALKKTFIVLEYNRVNSTLGYM